MSFEDDSHQRCGDTSKPKGRSGGMRSPDGIDPVEGAGIDTSEGSMARNDSDTGLEESSVIKGILRRKGSTIQFPDYRA